MKDKESNSLSGEKVRIQILISDELDREIKGLACVLGKSKYEVVNDALIHFLESISLEEEMKKALKRKSSQESTGNTPLSKTQKKRRSEVIDSSLLEKINTAKWAMAITTSEFLNQAFEKYLSNYEFKASIKKKNNP